MTLLPSQPIKLYSPLSPAACAARLAAAMDPMSVRPVSLTFPPGAKPVIGNVTGTSLVMRKRIGYRSSFQSFLTATLGPEAAGTAIAGTVGLPQVVTVFLLAWFGFAILAGVPMAVFLIWSMLSSKSPNPAIWGVAMLPIGMIGSGIVMLLFGRSVAGEESGFLVDFVRRTLEARDHQ
jgi:hypothetical protein